MAGIPRSHLGKRARGQQADVGSQFVPAAPAPAQRPTGTFAGQQSRTQDASTPTAHQDSNKTAPGSADKLFRCGQCEKAYSRVDHLSRHVRSHTQERPFICRQCEKSFSRADLLKRHMTLHDPVVSRTGRQSTAPQENRVSQACEECARLHIKCADEKPCRRCEARGVACIYPNVATTATASSGAEAVAAHDLLSLAASSHFQHQPAQPGPVAGQVLPERRAMPIVGVPDAQQHHQVGSLYDGHSMTGAVMSQQTPAYWEVPVAPEERIHDFLRAVMMGQDNMGGTGLLPGTRTPRNMFDFGNGAEDWSLNDMDMMFIDDYSHHIPFLAASETAPSTGPAAFSDENDAEPTHERPPRSLPPTGVDATRKWRFQPVTKDSSDANLSVPVTTESHKRPKYHDRRVLSEPLSNSARDSMLTLVATAGSQDPRPVTSFPSTELLDSLLQFFLSTTAATSYICHTPTFSPNRRPFLTLAMIAAGAALTPDAPLQKLGMVFQEAVRVTLPVMIEKDNTLIRDVEMLQTAYINLQHGFWSGNSRKMELAESFMGPWATMVRRAGWFSRSRYEMIAPGPDDDGDVLQEKWKRWIAQESWKRLVLFIIEHDTQVSLMLSTNPNISYAELHFPLPYHAVLWHAGSAQAWKTAFLSNPSHSSSPPPSVLDLLKDVDGLATPSPSFDVHAASQGLLCAAWGLVHEYRQLSGIVSSSSGPNQWHHGSLLLSSRLAELKKLLECIRLGSNGANGPGSLFLLEALSMHLHLSLDHVHLFAGVEGYQEAQRAFPILKAWIRTPTARQAIWHAGQILRLAKESVQTVRDFAVVLVYQATLALWSFGIISGVAPSEVGNGLQPEDHQWTILTGRDTVEVSRFISLGRGNPAVSGLAEDQEQQPVVLLSDVGRVMHVIKRLLSIKGQQDGRTTPKLVENIIDLVEELRRAVSV